MLQLPVQLLRGNYLKGVNALATIASVRVTVIAIHQGSNLLRASIHKLWAINKLEPRAPGANMLYTMKYYYRQLGKQWANPEMEERLPMTTLARHPQMS